MSGSMVDKLRNIMRKDPGLDGDVERLRQIAWMLFLKAYDAQEKKWETNAVLKNEEPFTSIIPDKLRWRNWAVNKDGKGKTGEELLKLVDDELFPTLKNLEVDEFTPLSKRVVRDVFEGLGKNEATSGVCLRQVIDVINEKDLGKATDKHEVGEIYEKILKYLQSASSTGEFYTPRALTDFIVEILDPRLKETFADFASGTGGFLVSALTHLRKQIDSAEDMSHYQNAVRGQEWKALPYLLSITNLMLHDVEAPNIRHCDSFDTGDRQVSEPEEKDCVDVIAMNPPFGGSTGIGVKVKFPSGLFSSETADLFMVLIMYRLKEGGRAGVIVHDGFLFGSDPAEIKIKTKLLKEFNLHTIIRLPTSVFSPYTGIATNILFFNKKRAKGAEKGFYTNKTWFYRLDMPEGYKHFSKTKPILLKHCEPIREWWDNRREIILKEGDEKSRCFSAQELLDNGCNFDLCKFPKEEEKVLPPAELLERYFAQRRALDEQIDSTLAEIQKMLAQ